MSIPTLHDPVHDMSHDKAATAGLGRAGLEVLFPELAAHVDRTPPAARERFLAKAFLLLADASGDVDLALRCLKDAAESGAVKGRGSAS